MKLYSLVAGLPLVAAPACLAPHYVLPILGIIAAVAVVVLIVVVLLNKAPATAAATSFLGHLSQLNGHPLSQLVGHALASRVQTFGLNAGHVLLDGLMTLLTPGSAPSIPGVNAATDSAAKKTAGGAPSAGQSPPPIDPEWQQLVLQTWEAYQARKAGKPAPTVPAVPAKAA